LRPRAALLIFAIIAIKHHRDLERYFIGCVQVVNSPLKASTRPAVSPPFRSGVIEQRRVLVFVVSEGFPMPVKQR
jgi:hypothetical protein